MGFLFGKKKKDSPPQEIDYYDAKEAVIWGVPNRITFLRTQRTYENIRVEYVPNPKMKAHTPKETLERIFVTEFNQKLRRADVCPLLVDADEPEGRNVRIHSCHSTEKEVWKKGRFGLCRIEKSGERCRFRKVGSDSKNWFDINPKCLSEDIINWGAAYIWFKFRHKVFCMKAPPEDRKRALLDESAPAPWEPEREDGVCDENYRYYDDDEAMIWGWPNRITFLRTQRTYENIRAEYVITPEDRSSYDEDMLQWKFVTTLNKELEQADFYPLIVKADEAQKVSGDEPCAYKVPLHAFLSTRLISYTESYGLCRVVKNGNGCRFRVIDEDGSEEHWEDINPEYVSRDVADWGAAYIWYDSSVEGRDNGKYYILKASPAERERAFAAVPPAE